MKQVKWHFDQITAEVTGTNIQKTIFRKRDFFDALHQHFLDNGVQNKREAKAVAKADETEKSG